MLNSKVQKLHFISCLIINFANLFASFKQIVSLLHFGYLTFDFRKTFIKEEILLSISYHNKKHFDCKEKDNLETASINSIHLNFRNLKQQAFKEHTSVLVDFQPELLLLQNSLV